MVDKKIFNISKTERIECYVGKTRNGFKHTAEFFKGNKMIEHRSVSYLNRTWERFEFDTVIEELLEKMKLSETVKARIKKAVEDINMGNRVSMDRSMLALTALGDVFYKNKAKKNEFKVRMLKAKGVSFPSDWDSLSESVKEKRLKKVEQEMRRGIP